MDATLERILSLSTSAVSDALDRFGVNGVLDGYVSVISDAKIVGPAYTVRETSAARSDKRFDVGVIVDSATEGSVLVIDVEGKTDASTTGGNAALGLKKKGVQGVLINGACRDVDEIRAMNLPVFARGTTPRTGQRRLATLELGGTLNISGVTVNLGDIVFCDSTGAVVIPKALVKDVLAEAEKIEARDKSIQRGLARGLSYAAATKEADTR